MIRFAGSRPPGRGVAVLGAAVVALLAGCGTMTGATTSGPPVLRIGTAQSGSVPAAGVAGDAVTGPSSGASDDAYPLVGTLPEGPPSAVVHPYPTTSIERPDVAVLATALGVQATPVRHAHGWVAGSVVGVVRVRDGSGAWSFTRESSPCTGFEVDVDAGPATTSAVGCAVAAAPTAAPAPAASGAGAPSTPATTSADVTDAAALSAAAPVLLAVGLRVADATVEPGAGAQRYVSVDPAVDGAPTSGAATSVIVDATGVVAAQGILRTPTAGPAYPLISAAQALQRLRALPRPAMAIMCPQGATCPGVGPQVVTGARLGLVLRSDAGADVLVPAWFFDIRGSRDPAVLVAVADAYLADPEPAASTPAGSSGGSSGGGSSSAGSPPDATSSFTPVPPAPPPTASAPAPGPARTVEVNSVSLGKDDRTLVLTGIGGVCASYRAGVQETETEVVVSILEVSLQPPDMACPDLAKMVTVTTTLARPWDHRAVTDAATGRALTVS